MAGDDDFWACTACRSINAKRSGRCYRCNAPKGTTGVAPTALPTIRDTTAAVGPTGRYRSSRIRALLVCIMILVVLVLFFATLSILQASATEVATGVSGAGGKTLDDNRPILVGWLVSIAVALLAYAAWISRVVDNLPALGLGHSRVSPRMAFVEPLVVGLNLLKMPARIGEITRRLDPGGRSQALIAAAWFAIVAPLFVLSIIIRAIILFTPSNHSFLAIVDLEVVAYGVEAVGFIIGILLIIRVERLCAARYRAIQDASLTTPWPTVGTPTR